MRVDMVTVEEDWTLVRLEYPDEAEDAITKELSDDGFHMAHVDSGFAAAFELGAELVMRAVAGGGKVFFFDSEFFWAVVGTDEADVKARIRAACDRALALTKAG